MSDDTGFTFEGHVEIFPQEGGWYYVAVPAEISDDLADLADRGLIAVHASIGDTVWPTSLMPMGDGTHFVALNARVRSATGLVVGDPTAISVRPRRR